MEHIVLTCKAMATNFVSISHVLVRLSIFFDFVHVNNYHQLDNSYLNGDYVSPISFEVFVHCATLRWVVHTPGEC